MAQFGWPNCPTEVYDQVETFTSEITRILDGGLLGVYLHGSLAMGCFNPDRSDVDLLVVTHEAMDLGTKREVAGLLLKTSGAPRPMEVSFLLKDVLGHWEHPTPFDLHYGEDWRNRYEAALADGSWRDWNAEMRKDPDLAAHITVTNHRGVCLQGAPITSVFPAVPRHDYLDSILHDVRGADHWIVRSPVYNMLNLCRVHYYLAAGAICSKDEGGVWGTHNLPPEFRPLVRQALAVYCGEQTSVEADPAALDAFARWTLTEIERLAAGGGV